MTELILGGARSGKSARAEACAEAMGGEVVYVATATAGDAEMAERIARHQADRPGHWGLVEEPFRLGAVIRRESAPGRCLLVDCLSLWLVNLLEAEEGAFARERADLLAALGEAAGPVILVSNEVGWGVVPMGEATRRYVDEQGRLNQAVAAACRRVTLVAAGLPLPLKDESEPQ
jgi:adenosylcobinamide kinase/adenosylcobinamide-phosphate guanylyltransferase